MLVYRCVADLGGAGRLGRVASAGGGDSGQQLPSIHQSDEWSPYAGIGDSRPMQVGATLGFDSAVQFLLIMGVDIKCHHEIARSQHLVNAVQTLALRHIKMCIRDRASGLWATVCLCRVTQW